MITQRQHRKTALIKVDQALTAWAARNNDYAEISRDIGYKSMLGIKHRQHRDRGNVELEDAIKFHYDDDYLQDVEKAISSLSLRHRSIISIHYQYHPTVTKAMSRNLSKRTISRYIKQARLQRWGESGGKCTPDAYRMALNEARTKLCPLIL